MFKQVSVAIGEDIQQAVENNEMFNFPIEMAILSVSALVHRLITIGLTDGFVKLGPPYQEEGLEPNFFTRYCEEGSFKKVFTIISDLQVTTRFYDDQRNKVFWRIQLFEEDRKHSTFMVCGYVDLEDCGRFNMIGSARCNS